MTEKLTELFGKAKDENQKIIGNYIIWQLSTMKNREIAETTAEEFVKGVFKLDDIFKTVISEAKKRASNNCAVMPSTEVFAIVRKAISIDGVVSPQETVGFNPFSEQTGISAPAEKIPASVDFDSLWD